VKSASGDRSVSDQLKGCFRRGRGLPRMFCIMPAASVSLMIPCGEGPTTLTFGSYWSTCDEKCFAKCKAVRQNPGIEAGRSMYGPFFNQATRSALAQKMLYFRQAGSRIPVGPLRPELDRNLETLRVSGADEGSTGTSQSTGQCETGSLTHRELSTSA